MVFVVNVCSSFGRKDPLATKYTRKERVSLFICPSHSGLRNGAHMHTNSYLLLMILLEFSVFIHTKQEFLLVGPVLSFLTLANNTNFKKTKWELRAHDERVWWVYMWIIVTHQHVIVHHLHWPYYSHLLVLPGTKQHCRSQQSLSRDVMPTANQSYSLLLAVTAGNAQPRLDSGDVFPMSKELYGSHQTNVPTGQSVFFLCTIVVTNFAVYTC